MMLRLQEQTSRWLKTQLKFGICEVQPPSEIEIHMHMGMDSQVFCKQRSGTSKNRACLHIQRKLQKSKLHLIVLFQGPF